MEIFAKNIARGGLFDTHISKVYGKDVSVILKFTETTELEISNEKKITIDLETTDPSTIVERVCEVLKNFDLGLIEYGVICSEFYFFIEKEDITYLQDVFNLDFINFDFEKCAVCYNATSYKTGCGHDVCCACLSKCSRCPLCRLLL